jgi:ketosteroid isomerase-like protein
MRAVPTLSIEWSLGALRYRLELPERDPAEPLQEEFRHPLDEGTLRALQESAEALLRSAESARFADEARVRGGVLYRTLVPVRLRGQLKAVRGPLLVSTSLTGMPWELLHDEEEFWGLRYALGKRLVMDRPLPAGGTARVRARPRALIVGSDPRGGLPFVAHEVEVICEALERFADIECVTGRLATFETVMAALGGDFDLIHYCGHVVTGAAHESALLLGDGKTLPASAIEANLAGRPLVFLNGCATARGQESHATGSWEASFSSVAYGFLFGGAMGVVGTLADVSDRHAAALAAEFYRGALEKAPVGEALRAARAHSRADPETAGSPTWLSVVLYGNPAQVLLRRAEDAEEVSAPPRPAVVGPRVEPRGPRRRIASMAALVLAIALVAGLLHLRRTAPPTPLVVGVMDVRRRGPNVPPWMRELTRDALDTILSKFPQLRVYSRQKIDFLRERRHLSEIEAAEALGMSKMLSATIASDGTRVTLELQVVDIATGLLQGADSLQGPADRLIDLQTEFAFRALRVLGVEPTPDEMKAVVASRTDQALDVYRLFKDTLGDAPAGGTTEPAPRPQERAPGTSWLEWRASAHAEEANPDETAIRALLDRYGAVLAAKDVDGLAGLQLSMSDAQRASLLRYFEIAQDLQVRISDVEVAVEGDEALATFTREDTFTDRRSGRRMHLEVRTSGVLTRHQGAWKIRGLREPS